MARSGGLDSFLEENTAYQKLSNIPVEVGGETGDSEAPMIVVEEFFGKELYILIEKQRF